MVTFRPIFLLLLRQKSLQTRIAIQQPPLPLIVATQTLLKPRSLRATVACPIKQIYKILKLDHSHQTLLKLFIAIQIIEEVRLVREYFFEGLVGQLVLRITKDLLYELVDVFLV